MIRPDRGRSQVSTIRQVKLVSEIIGRDKFAHALDRQSRSVTIAGRDYRARSALCSATAPSDDWFGCVPKWSLWRRVARVLAQVMACLAHWDARPAGGGADVGDRREQGVLPEVVGLPPGHLIKQVRFGPAVKGCCGQHRVLELRVLPAAEGALGQEPLA
jgi:hypothetical protein